MSKSKAEYKVQSEIDDIIRATSAERAREQPLCSRAYYWVKSHANRTTLFGVQVVACAFFWLCFSASTMKEDEIAGTKTYSTVWYGLLIMINSLFSCYYALIAVRQENRFQLGCCAATLITVMVRGALTIRRKDENAGSYMLFSIACILALSTMAMMYPVGRTFGWNIFRKVGGDRRLKDMYMQYELFLALLRLDVQFLTMCFVLFLCFIDGSEVFSVPLIFVSYSSDVAIQFAVRRENRTVTMAWLVFKLGMPAWWLFTLIRYLGCYSDWSDCSLPGCRNRPAPEPLAPAENASDRSPADEVLPPVFERYHDACLRDVSAQKIWVEEAFLMIVIQALVTRLVLLVSTYLVVRNYGGGLIEIFQNEGGLGSPRSPKSRPELEENLVKKGGEVSAFDVGAEGGGLAVAS
eukprot:TRINITY_DN56377_c0_g1_i1.p1 TRINITY_DN56377_c0_g1~~TRINITY_DN56377_c0_g1_i1.p1  ORF type:complete len:408 (+),score=130.73 TRINITY_DN56377_c0_g1_i1:132-1355(+)